MWCRPWERTERSLGCRRIGFPHHFKKANTSWTGIYVMASRAGVRVASPPDFLWSLVALAYLMRLSLLKAAHAAVGECHVAGNPGQRAFPLRTAPYLLAFELCCCFCVCAASAITRSQVGCSCCGSRVVSRNMSRPSPGKGMCANL